MKRIPHVQGEEQRPNVLFLFSDQYKARCLSCTGLCGRRRLVHLQH